MDENTLNEVRKLLSALKALQQSTTRAIHTGILNSGSISMILRTYETLHARLMDLMPDDFYITEALKVDFDENASDEEKLGQVNLAVEQLHMYLRDQARMENWFNTDEFRDIKNMGRELSDQIIGTTRVALRRALSNLDSVDIPMPPTPPDPPQPPTPKRKVDIDVDVDAETDDRDIDNPSVV